MVPDRQWKRARFHLIVTALIAAVLTATIFVPQTAFAAPTASPAAGASAASAATPTVAQMTQYVWEAQNQVRYDAGLTTGYARDTRLDKVASDWAYQQWKNGKMSHNPNYSTQIPSGWQRAGENVASGYSYTQVVPAWKASQSHYANIVNDYTSVGIGYYEADGKRYWSVVFAKYPGTSVPQKPAATPAPTATPTPTATPKPTATPTPTPTPTTAPASGSYSAEPAAPAGTLIALNSPSFEGATTGWSGGSGLEGPTTAARGGKYDLKATGGTVSQSVNVSPRVGETYTATVWVKPGGTSKISGSLKLSALGGTTESATVNFSVSSGWMKVSVPLSMTKAGHTSLRIDVVLSSGDIRLDSASLVRTKDAAPATASSAAAPSASPNASATPAPTASASPAPAATTAPAPAATTAPAPTAPAPAPAAPAPSPAPSSGGLLGGLLGL